MKPSPLIFGGLATVIFGAMTFIKPMEGTVYSTQPDPIGIQTACNGNRSVALPGAKFTEEECELLLLSDVIVHLVAVRKLVTVTIDTEQMISLTSLSFNIGIGAFRDSTLLKKLNAGDYEGAQAEFSRWRNAGGRPLPGLIVRRAREARLFNP